MRVGTRVTSLSAPGHIRLFLTPPLLDRIMAMRYLELSLSKLRMCHLSRQRGLRCMMKLRTWNRRLAWTTHKPFSQRESPALEAGAKECRQPSEDGENKHGAHLGFIQGPLSPSHKVGVMKNLTHNNYSVNVPPIPQSGSKGSPLQNSHPTTPCFQPSETTTWFLTPGCSGYNLSSPEGEEQCEDPGRHGSHPTDMAHLPTEYCP